MSNYLRASRCFTAKLAGLSCAAFLVFATPSVAQEISDSHLSVARATVKASGATSRFDLILPQLLQDVKTRFISNRPDLEAEITDVANEEAIAIAPRRADLEREVATIFARVFTEAELVELEAFYSTDTGKKLLAETDVISRQIVAASRVWANGIGRDLEINVTKTMNVRFGATVEAEEADAAADGTGAAAETQ
ncbi:MAG: DUF2059 domain-containing protein [Pseudomonadota bacterium]